MSAELGGHTSCFRDRRVHTQISTVITIPAPPLYRGSTSMLQRRACNKISYRPYEEVYNSISHCELAYMTCGGVSCF